MTEHFRCVMIQAYFLSAQCVFMKLSLVVPCFSDVPGYATIVVLILLLGGLILFSLGIISAYLARMYIQMKNRPIYIEKTYLQTEKQEEKQ